MNRACGQVGIIDILQKWDRWKQGERVGKAVLGKDLDGLSAMEPDLYKERFVKAMEGHMEVPGPAGAGGGRQRTISSAALLTPRQQSVASSRTLVPLHESALSVQQPPPPAGLDGSE